MSFVSGSSVVTLTVRLLRLPGLAVHLVAAVRGLESAPARAEQTSSRSTWHVPFLARACPPKLRMLGTAGSRGAAVAGGWRTLGSPSGCRRGWPGGTPARSARRRASPPRHRPASPPPAAAAAAAGTAPRTSPAPARVAGCGQRCRRAPRRLLTAAAAVASGAADKPAHTAQSVAWPADAVCSIGVSSPR